eukprot:SAG31_NODE_1546_length_7927_cov_29.239525_3_plen_62_part_00
MFDSVLKLIMLVRIEFRKDHRVPKLHCPFALAIDYSRPDQHPEIRHLLELALSMLAPAFGE